MRELCGEAIEAAAASGAAYTDVRALVRRSQYVATKNGRVEVLQDVESEGIGVRVLVDGAWGFASNRDLTLKGARDAAARATAFARAAAGRGNRRLVPVEARNGSHRTAFERDPFAVSLADKVALCLRAEEAMQQPDVRVTSAFVRALREQKFLLTSDGVEVDQETVECGGGIDATAVGDATVQIRSYPSATVGSSAQAGWEHVERLDLPGEGGRVGEEAAALLRADPCPAERTTIVLDCDQMASQVHESVGHPTELDRVYGTEAAYAGTSFLHPGDLDTLRYGSPLMNVTADATTPGGLGTFAYLLADVDHGLYLETNKSWSIDDKRLNFQFGTQIAWEIERGRRTRMLRDAVYTGITPAFWGSLDAVAGPEAWTLMGFTNCGKGQPGQTAHVSHGTAPARFRDVEVGVKP